MRVVSQDFQMPASLLLRISFHEFVFFVINSMFREEFNVKMLRLYLAVLETILQLNKAFSLGYYSFTVELKFTI